MALQAGHGRLLHGLGLQHLPWPRPACWARWAAASHRHVHPGCSVPVVPRERLPGRLLRSVGHGVVDHLPAHHHLLRLCRNQPGVCRLWPPAQVHRWCRAWSRLLRFLQGSGEDERQLHHATHRHELLHDQDRTGRSVGCFVHDHCAVQVLAVWTSGVVAYHDFEPAFALTYGAVLVEQWDGERGVEDLGPPGFDHGICIRGGEFEWWVPGVEVRPQFAWWRVGEVQGYGPVQGKPGCWAHLRRLCYVGGCEVGRCA